MLLIFGTFTFHEGRNHIFNLRILIHNIAYLLSCNLHAFFMKFKINRFFFWYSFHLLFKIIQSFITASKTVIYFLISGLYIKFKLILLREFFFLKAIYFIFNSIYFISYLFKTLIVFSLLLFKNLGIGKLNLIQIIFLYSLLVFQGFFLFLKLVIQFGIIDREIIRNFSGIVYFIFIFNAQFKLKLIFFPFSGIKLFLIISRFKIEFFFEICNFLLRLLRMQVIFFLQRIFSFQQSFIIDGSYFHQFLLIIFFNIKNLLVIFLL